MGYRDRARADYQSRLESGYTEAEALSSVAALYWVKPATMRSWLGLDV
jgi:hypothetical protein